MTRVRLALSLASLVILYWFWPEIELASLSYNDGVNHLAIIRAMDEIWSRGGNITDFWMAHVNFGHALLRSYQFLMHLVIWFLHKTIFSGIRLETCFNTAVALMAAALPWTFYRGTRLLGLGRFEAVATALAVVLVHEAGGYGIGLTNFTFSGYGTYNQLFALVFLPLALGFAHEALRTSRHVVLASLTFAAIFMGHILTGYMACLWIAIDATFFLISRRREKKAVRRALLALAKLAGLSLLWTAHWVLPMARDNLLQHHSEVESAAKWDGYGAAKMLGDFASGAIFDGGRMPILTVLAALGLALALWLGWRRRRETPRLISVQILAWLVLCFGPATLAFPLRLLPFSASLHWHRFFAMTEFAFALGIGLLLGQFWRWMTTGAERSRANTWGAVAACAALLFPCLQERQTYFHETNRHWLKNTVDWWAKPETNYKAALAFALTHRDARYAAGDPWTWGNKLLVTSYIPFYGLLSQFNVETVGAIYHHQPHAEIVAYKEEWKNPLVSELLNVRYVAFQKETTAPSGFSKILETSNAVLYDNGNRAGYFGVGTAAPGGCADNDGLRRAARAFLRGRLPTARVYPAIELARDCRGRLELDTAVQMAERNLAGAPVPGRILESGRAAAPGGDKHWARARLEQPGLILFKMNYHPGWRATVNGAPAATTMVLPAFVGVPVPAGDSKIEMEYQPDLLKRALLWLLPLSALAVAATALISSPRSSAWRRRRVR